MSPATPAGVLASRRGSGETAAMPDAEPETTREAAESALLAGDGALPVPDAALAPARLVCAHLDGPLTAAGFAAGQVGAGATQADALFCADYAEFRARHPGVAPDLDYGDDPGTCTDVTITVALGDPPLLQEARQDGWALDELLRDLGHADLADRTAALTGRPLDEALPVLEAAVRTLYTPAIPGTAGGPTR